MILSVHAVFGAAVASLVPNHPVEAFSIAFVSHFALDMIPHKDYHLISLEADLDHKPQIAETIYRKFRLIRDMTLVSFDALLGVCLAFLFFFNPIHPSIFLIGVVGSLLPDFFIFLYIMLKHRSLELFAHFHCSLIHSKIILNLNQITGVLVQFCTIAILIAILFGVKALI